jgi:uncharacterized beta-barrel protein YwiB (DUF1934 family)
MILGIYKMKKGQTVLLRNAEIRLKLSFIYDARSCASGPPTAPPLGPGRLSSRGRA